MTGRLITNCADRSLKVISRPSVMPFKHPTSPERIAAGLDVSRGSRAGAPTAGDKRADHGAANPVRPRTAISGPLELRERGKEVIGLQTEVARDIGARSSSNSRHQIRAHDGAEASRESAG